GRAARPAARHRPASRRPWPSTGRSRGSGSPWLRAHPSRVGAAHRPKGLDRWAAPTLREVRQMPGLDPGGFHPPDTILPRRVPTFEDRPGTGGRRAAAGRQPTNPEPSPFWYFARTLAETSAGVILLSWLASKPLFCS